MFYGKMIVYNITLFSGTNRMTELGNIEDMTEKFDEIKGLVDEIKEEMMSSEDCNNQFYAVLQNLDNIATSVSNIENEKSKPTDEYTILQTNILEVKKEISHISDTIDKTLGDNLQKVFEKLENRVSELENADTSVTIDPKIVMNITSHLEKEIKSTLNDATATLYDQQQNYSDTTKRTTDELKSKMKECVDYLENMMKAVSDDAVENLTSDISILGKNVEKTTDSLKKSVIDIFTKIEDSITEKIDSSAVLNSDFSELTELNNEFELLKNGIYNLNSNTEQKLTKMSRVISEMDLFRKLEKFAQLKDLPAIGELKQTLQSNIEKLVDDYSFSIQTSKNKTELSEVTQKFRASVYNELINLLGNASEFLLEESEKAEKESKSPLSNLTEKLEELTSVTELNTSSFDGLNAELLAIKKQCNELSDLILKNDVSILKANINDVYSAIQSSSDKITRSTEPDRELIKELLMDIKKNISIMQSGDEETDYTYSMQDIEADIAKIRTYLNELNHNGIKLEAEEFTNELTRVTLTVDSMKQQLNKIDECDLSETLSNMKEDLTSISTRVNKLLLSSDNSYNLIEASLKDFKELADDIDREIHNIADIDKFQTLEDSMTAIRIALGETNSYNSAISQSLTMLADWVDSAGETITNISNNQSKLDSIEEIKTILKNTTLILSQNSENVISSVKELLVENVPQPKDYSMSFDILSAALKEQMDIVQRQEERINKLDEKLTTILEITAKNDFGDIVSKINNIDTQMEKLNKSIEKLTAYVNED